MAENHCTQAHKWIERAYDQQPEREWERLERHRTEFAVTMRAFAEHLPTPPARVLDCGGGPGRYTIELCRQGYEVILFDLSSGCLNLAKTKATEARVILRGYERGTATDLSRFPDDTFDAVLLMGPLYHLLKRENRLRALTEARRVLKSGGSLFAAFISRYAAHRWAAAHEPAWTLERPELADTILTTGILPPRGETGTAFAAHFAHPREIVPLLQDAGFEVVDVLGAEGLVSMIEENVNALQGEAWEFWAGLNYRVAADPSIHGCVEHLLAVAIKPRWRAVLRQIAQELNEAGASYKVVGGTAVALHGAQVPVNDLDLEMDAADAYDFQQAFADHTVEPVALRESEIYRSHFGRFDFDGFAVEVMGALCRREASDWVPTATQTETTVDLDGVPVRVPWLEEETLAYIRRGRLDRAAQCLPLCDHGRLLELLRGTRATNVLGGVGG